MASVLAIRDGETYTHLDLMPGFKMKTERGMKDLIDEMDIPYFVSNGVWYLAGEDIRKCMRVRAMTHSQRKEAKQEA
jgi:hypothetical protein